ncbi:MAG: BC10 family protein [Oscillospiraceae bacterium]|nr:BC10 family protein [Oscillospiraceae bacterium]
MSRYFCLQAYLPVLLLPKPNKAISACTARFYYTPFASQWRLAPSITFFLPHRPSPTII